MVKLLEDDFFLKKELLPGTYIIEFEGMENNKIEISKTGIQMTNQEKVLNME